MPSKEGRGAGVPQMNEKDALFTMAILKNISSRPSADWAAVAQGAGLKDDKQSKEKFRVLSVKYGWAGAAQPPQGDAKPTEGDIRFMKALFDGLFRKPEADVSLPLFRHDPTTLASTSPH